MRMGSSDHLCLSAQEFAKNDFEFISSDVTKSNWSSRYPIPRNNFCGADCLNSFVVGPTGALYKCWNDIGHPNRVVGSLTDSSIKAYRDIMYQYLLFDPTQDSKWSQMQISSNLHGRMSIFSAETKS